VLDLHQLVYWLGVMTLFVAAPFLLVRRPGAPERRLVRLGAAALTYARPEPEAEEDVDLHLAIRRERLLADLERLTRLLATDMTKSAVRQLGNRLAYGQLLQELAETPELATPGRDRYASRRPEAVPARMAGAAPRPGPSVETIEFGWRR